MGMPSGFELLMIFGAVILLFGGKKIPELAKGLGQGIKNFKAALSSDGGDTDSIDDDTKAIDKEEQPQAKAKKTTKTATTTAKKTSAKKATTTTTKA